MRKADNSADNTDQRKTNRMQYRRVNNELRGEAIELRRAARIFILNRELVIPTLVVVVARQ